MGEWFQWSRLEPPSLVSCGLALAAVVSCLTVAGMNAARADVKTDTQVMCAEAIKREQMLSDQHANATLAKVLEDQRATEQELEQLQMLATEFANRLGKLDTRTRERVVRGLVMTDDALYVTTLGMTLPFKLKRVAEADGTVPKGTITEVTPIIESGSELGLTLPTQRVVFRRDQETNVIVGIDFREQ